MRDKSVLFQKHKERGTKRERKRVPVCVACAGCGTRQDSCWAGSGLRVRTEPASAVTQERAGRAGDALRMVAVWIFPAWSLQGLPRRAGSEQAGTPGGHRLWDETPSTTCACRCGHTCAPRDTAVAWPEERSEDSWLRDPGPDSANTQHSEPLSAPP